MRSHHIARQYKELAVKSATPVGLIVLLYEVAIESMAHAMLEIDSGNIEARTNDLNHALTVISELERSLNFEAGGEVAQRLANLYNVARCKILEANIKSSKETLEQLTAVFSSLREAWQIVDQETGAQPATASSLGAPRSSSSSAPQQTHDDDSTLQWSA